MDRIVSTPAADVAFADPSTDSQPSLARELERKIRSKAARIAVIGLGYVGLPLAVTAAHKGFAVSGLDTDPEKPRLLGAGISYLDSVPEEALRRVVDAGTFAATSDFSVLGKADVIVICVPTPLSPQREPDLSYVIGSTRSVADHLRRGQLVVLESTTWPGTSEEVVLPILEQGSLRSGRDFFLAYSPEREDPGNAEFTTSRIARVVGGHGDDARSLALAFYGELTERTVPVSSMRTAEAVKLTENIFRAVNIALINELKVVYDAMGIDIWEVVDAAKTKPFGFMPFYPGPGMGGHCVPIDPFYLTWKAREYDISTRFIELAGEINNAMPLYVVSKLATALDERQGRGLKGARVLIVGIAYKKNVADVRESPALRIMDCLRARGANVAYYDPRVAAIPRTRRYPELTGLASIAWEPERLAGYDAAIIVTDHDGTDYAALVGAVPLVVDTRNATRDVSSGREKIVRA